MAGPDPTDPDLRDAELARRVDAVCRRFEADWKQDQRPPIEPLLDELAAPGRPALLVELIALERELRWARGERPDRAEYLARFPGHATEVAAAFEEPGPSGEAEAFPPADPTLEDTPGDGGARGRSDMSPVAGRYFGDYELGRELARGGMGVVFKARQVPLNRTVALKMILSGRLASDAEVKRFYLEAEAAANLDHPAIVPIHEFGQHDGQHYFSMGFVEGQSLSQKLAAGPLPPREAARLLREVAGAVQYAHDHGVIHRDLKPANILLDAGEHPKVTDFGLAKKLEGDSELTASGQVVGTPSYMPPEQASGHQHVSPPADVYSLGAILYHLLTGRPPFQAASVMETLKQVVESEPVAPRALNAQVPRDLETIALKCLQKDPPRRYHSAAALATDLDNWLSGRPITARPVGPAGRFGRWCKRNPWLAGANIAAAALTLALAVGATVAALVYREQVRTVDRERKATQQAEREGRRRMVDALAGQADAARYSNRPGQRFTTLDAIASAVKILDSLGSSRDPGTAAQRDRLRDLAIAALALPDIRPVRTVGKLPGGDVYWDVDPTYTLYAVAEPSGNCVVHRLADGTEVMRLPKQGRSGECWPRFGPGGRTLLLYLHGRIQLWRLDGATPTLIMARQRPVSPFVSFRPGSDAEAAIADAGRLTLLDLRSGRERDLPPTPGALPRYEFHPDGRHLNLVVQRNGVWSAQVRALDDPRPEAEIVLPVGRGNEAVESIAWSADGRRLALALTSRQVFVWRIDSSRIRVLTGFENAGQRLAFNHGGDLLATIDFDGVLRLWDPETSQHLLGLRGACDSIRFSPDDRHLLLGIGGQLQLVEVAPARACRVLPEEPGGANKPEGLAFGIGDRVLAARKESGLGLWDVELREKRADLTTLGWAPAQFASSGAMITAGQAGLLEWPAQTGPGGSDIRLGLPRMLLDVHLRGNNFSATADGRVVVLSAKHEGAYAWIRGNPERTVHLGPQPDVRYVAVSPDGHWAATVSHIGDPRGDVGVHVWNVATGQRVAVLAAPNMSKVAFSPDGRSLVTARDACQVWSALSWRLERTIGTQGGHFAFSPDGCLLALCAGDVIRLYDFASGRPVATLSSPDTSNVGNPAFSADGTRLAVNAASHRIHVWDLRRVRASLAALGLDWDAPPLASPPPDDGPTPPEPVRLDVVGGTPAGLQWAEREFGLRDRPGASGASSLRP
jgi:WD40 repeat protein/tRNA A-37 threonylcarbamoyl transferase component Bud32